MSRPWLPLVGSVLLFLSPPLVGDDFQGAATLIDRLKSVIKAPATAPSTKDDYAQLAKDLLLFTKQSASLQPDDAARQWLALFDRSLALRNDSRSMSNGARELVQALPGPASWPELQKLVEPLQPEKPFDPWHRALLLLIVHTLNNVEDKQWADLDTIAKLPSDPSQPQLSSGIGSVSVLLTLGSKLSLVAGNSEALENFWTHLLTKLDQAGPVPVGFEPTSLELPDWVTLLGEAKAQPLLLSALRSPFVKITRVNGMETQNLASKLALANVDKITQPPWCLTESLDTPELYEALSKKFPPDQNSSAAPIYHVLALVVNGKTDEAVKAASVLEGYQVENAASEAAEKGYGQQIYDFFHALLKAHPESNTYDWKTYIQLAAQTDHAQEALQFVQDSLARTDLNDVARSNIGAVLYRALLAVDKVDEGVEELRTLIKNTKTAVDTPAPSTRGGWTFASHTGTALPGHSHDIEIVEWDIDLAKIGHLLKRDALESEGLDDARLRTDKDSLIAYLMQTGRNAEAEKLLINAIVDTAKNERPNPRQWYDYGQESENRRNLLKLAELYYNAGRWHDIITLLEQAPGWNATDLVGIAGEKTSSYRYSTPSLGLIAARAFSETGQTNQARPILDYVLQIDGGDDAAYALLLKIGKGDLVAKLDALYRQDQFQNRPLIWKATVLLQHGKVAEAEEACKAAIAVDPSDGQTGKGDRMRVYSVMANVCEAKKDAKQADFFHNVVKAIRLSEDADDFYDAGLLTRAVGMYAKALDLFSDAYCIQSRIARQLAQLGRTEEAAAHYRKAFELMPVSFGRLESHCFGCERAFEGKTAVAIAEKTFNDMLAKDPKKPQISYLLGYLYMEERRYPEAVAHFKTATELDPDYINAWKQIMDIGTDYQLTPDLRDAAVFNVIRLDPAARHISPQTENVRQLAKLWQVETTASEAILPPPASLLAMKGSAAEQSERIERMEKAIPSGVDARTRTIIEQQMKSQLGIVRKTGPSPRDIFTTNGVLSTACEFFR